MYINHGHGGIDDPISGKTLPYSKIVYMSISKGARKLSNSS